MAEWILKSFALWEVVLMTAVVSGMVGVWFGKFIERLNWEHDCLLERVRPGKYIDFVCRWKPKHAPAPPTTIEVLEQQLRNAKTAHMLAHQGHTWEH